MMNRMKNRFLITTAALLAGVSLASAQNSGGGVAGEKGMSTGQSGGGMSQSAPSRSGAMTQGRGTESREGGRAEGPAARESESGRAQRDEPSMRDRGRAEGPRDGGKGQTMGQGRSDRDDARHSQESSKEQRDTSKDRAQQPGQKDQTVGQGRSDRDDARRSEDRTRDKGKADSQQAQQPSRQNQTGSGMQGQNAQERNPGSGQNVTQGQANAPAQSQTAPAQGQAAAPVQGQTTAASQTQPRPNLTSQQQTTLQQSVLGARSAPRVNANSINFQVHAGVAVPSGISVVSASTYPALIDTFPAYRDHSFFVVDDEVVFVDRDRRVVDVVPAGPRTRFSGGGHGGGGSVAAIDLPPDDIRIVQRVLIERGLLRGEADGVLSPQTREAITVYQRQQGIQVTGIIDASTVSSLGVSGRLSQQANQSIGQSQSSTTGAQTSTTGQGQAGTGQAQSGQQQPTQQNAAGQAPNPNQGQAANSPVQQNQPTTTGQSTAPNQSNTTGQAAPQTQSGNQPTASPKTPSGQRQGPGSPWSQPEKSSTSSR